MGILIVANQDHGGHTIKPVTAHLPRQFGTVWRVHIEIKKSDIEPKLFENRRRFSALRQRQGADTHGSESPLDQPTGCRIIIYD